MFSSINVVNNMWRLLPFPIRTYYTYALVLVQLQSPFAL
jgi:hypothetical protein